MQVTARTPLLRHALAEYLSPILDDCCGNAAQVAVALSGGPDSMALALLMHDWCAEHHVPLTTLTVDHQLRAESAAEATQVAQWMRALGIAHHILTPTADATIRNTQARARDMRYRAMLDRCRAHGATHLLLAQHYDDQAETVALQQHRGDTPPSRAGMALCRMQDGVQLVRPLLGVRKATLITYLKEHGQPWVADPSNENDSYARNRLRGTLVDTDALWREAQRMGEQRNAEDVARYAWFSTYAPNGSIDLAAWRTLDAARQRDYLSHAIRCIGGKAHRPRLHESEHLAQRVFTEASGKATLGLCIVAWSNGSIHLNPEHPLEAAASGAYMAPSPTPNALVSEPFWWFNYAPYNDGANSRAPTK